MTARPDGRSETTLRPLTCELSGLQNCDGSALWKSGSTHVLAAVHGPTAPRALDKALPDRAIVTVVLQSGNHPTLEREWEVFLTRILSGCVQTQLYPRTVISVVVQILSADGSVLAAALQASVAALMDASIDLSTVPTATTCALVSESSNSIIQLDPCAQEEQSSQACLVLVLDPNADEKQGNVLGIHTPALGAQSPQDVLMCCTMAGRAVPAIHAFVRMAVEQKVTREAQTLWSS